MVSLETGHYVVHSTTLRRVVVLNGQRAPVSEPVVVKMLRGRTVVMPQADVFVTEERR